MDVLTRVPVREQEPAVRAANFEEVCLGYNKEEAVIPLFRPGSFRSLSLPPFYKNNRIQTKK